MLCIARTMLSQDVRPSVRHTPVYLEMAKRIIKLSSLSGSHTILVFFVPNVMAILRWEPSYNSGVK